MVALHPGVREHAMGAILSASCCTDQFGLFAAPSSSSTGARAVRLQALMDIDTTYV